MTDDDRYGIEELATLGGVNRRTVRFYVREGLLPPPLGVGRGRHYDGRHLATLRRLKALQEAGHTLAEVRSKLRRGERGSAGRGSADGEEARVVSASEPPTASWRHVTLAPGVQLHLAEGVHVEPADGWEALATWIARYVRRERSGASR